MSCVLLLTHVVHPDCFLASSYCTTCVVCAQEFVTRDVVTTPLKESDRSNRNVVSIMDLIQTAEFLEIDDLLDLAVVKVCSILLRVRVLGQRAHHHRVLAHPPARVLLGFRWQWHGV